MSFNHGFKCPNCGPVKESKKRSINKIQRECCKVCGEVVSKWDRPLNERPGRCNNCGFGSFILAMYQKTIIRKCKKCDEVSNPDTGEILRKGRGL